jgi:hypothetical protein
MRNPARARGAVTYEPQIRGSQSRGTQEVSGEMKKIGSVVLCCIGIAAIGAGAATAQNSTPNPNQVASQICTGELHAMGVNAFKQFYGDPHKSGDPSKNQHAMRNCKRRHGHQAGNLVSNVAQLCKAEQADPTTIAGNTSNLTFDQFYGTSSSDHNAFGKCVSGKVHEAVAQVTTNLQNAAQQCRAARNNPSTIPGNTTGKTFTEFYGTNKNKKNAFGKCVSQKAKALNSATS